MTTDPGSTSSYIDAEGIWCEVLHRGSARARPCLFLDRDGVIVEEVNYLHRPEDCRLERGAAAIIRKANEADIRVVVVTNQAGIARGYFGWEDFRAVQDCMVGLLAAEGARLDAVFACPHHAKGRPPFGHPDHPARKPNPGMLTRAFARLAILAGQSWIIGDRASDLGAGRNAGLAGGVHVGSGHGGDDGERQKALALAEPGFQVLARASIAEADGLDLFRR
ncbi:MAG: D-glycero-alpha-D-manno-heptose-1,7-bisphosphate 7-phosphatase [Rhodospirillales bacterium]